MKSLFAPWRMQYIRGAQKQQGCFLCRAAAAKKAELAALLVLHHDQRTLALLNRFPYGNGHLLVAPVAHKEELAELSPAERAALMDTVVLLTGALRRALSPHGFNIGLNLGRDAGAGLLGHLHFHIVPRWRGDTNYMPVVADTKVIPQALEETYRLISRALKCRRQAVERHLG